MREQLLGYLMGALDASQQSEVEQALERDPQLRQELDQLNRALEPLRADRTLHEPPRGLADRTLDAVAAVAGWPDANPDTRTEPGEDAACEIEGEAQEFAEQFFADEAAHEAPTWQGAERQQARLSPVAETAVRPWANRWAALDVVASAGIIATAAMLFFPAIANSRFQARIIACQKNLQAIARGLENYSENHEQQFVPIPESGNLSFAGIYGPTLLHDGYVAKSNQLFCAGALAAQGNDGTSETPRIPEFSELERAVGKALRRMQDQAGGSYGYNLGYWVNGRYSPIRALRRPTFAVMADVPSPQQMTGMSPNHEARGLNVLFEDGHIEYRPSRLIDAAGADDIFRSDRGLVEAGLHVDDAVIGSSRARPILLSYPNQP